MHSPYRMMFHLAMCTLLAISLTLSMTRSINAQSGQFVDIIHTFTSSQGRLPITSYASSSNEPAFVQGSDGWFYGVAPYGGANSSGTVFKINPAGNSTSNLTVLYTFQGTADGANPQALVMDPSGNLWGNQPVWRSQRQRNGF